MYENYKNLDLYKKTEKLTLSIYRLSQKFPDDERYGLVSQIRRAVISVAANFVEGYGRKGIKEKMQFLHISLGSLNEIEFYIVIAHKLEYISNDEFDNLMKQLKDVEMLFSDYIRGIRKKNTISELRTPNSGQSLIETIMAIFILTTGLASGLALAVFSFSSASDISEKIVATGLAREGVESVRRMRDSNWIAGSLASCSDLGSGQQCYSTWLSQTYGITGSTGSGTDYRLHVNAVTTGNKWVLQNNSNYRLFINSNGAINHGSGGTPTNFYRKITIIYEDTSSPYSAQSPLVLVRSSVWWHGKNCAAITNLTNPSQTNCKIISEEYLTNWRNY